MSGRTNPYDIESVKGYPDALQIYRIAASKFWQVRFFTGRKYLRKSTKCENKSDATAFAKRFFEDIKLAERLDIDIHRDTFAACANHMMKRQEKLVARGERDDRIVTEDRKKLDLDILPFFGTMSVGSVTTSTLYDYLDHIGQRKLAPSTISKHLVVIRKVLNEAHRREYIKSLPLFPSVKRKDNPRPYFTRREMRKVRSTAFELAREGISVRGVPLTEEIRDFIVFAVMVYVRPSDLKLLRHRDIEGKSYSDDDGKMVRYLSIVPPNSKTVTRESASRPEAVSVYERLVARHAAANLAGQDDFVFFPQFQNRAYALATIRRQFEFVVEKAGLSKDRYGQKRTLYSLRHSALMYQFQLSKRPDIFMMARNALTSVGQLERFYLSHVESAMKIKELMTLRAPRSSSAG
jgi:Phage integrase SAM-like domain